MAAAVEHESLESAVIAALPGHLGTCCRFAGYQNGEMTLTVPDSTRASQLRFQQRLLLRALRQDKRFDQLWRIRIRVQPWFRPAVRQPHSPPVPSRENARLLEQEAVNADDPELGDILRRLASHGHQ